MLKIEVDEAVINLLHKAMLDSGGDGIKQAMELRTIRNVLDNLVEAFNRRQVQAARTKPALILSDGLLASLRAALAPSGQQYSWPSRSGRLLQGLDLRAAQPSFQPLRPEDYCCKLTFGPPQARRFGAYCALFSYSHANTTGRVIWMGREAEFADVMADYLIAF